MGRTKKSMINFKPIESDRLSIRILDTHDKEVFFAYRCLPEVYLYQSWKPSGIDEVEEFINKNKAIRPNTKDTWMQLGIHLKDGVLIGDVGVHFLEDEAQVEIGYTLSPDHQGCGYAQEAVKTVIDYLFLTLRKHRITASVDPDNAKSINLLEKLGFRQEAHFKKSVFIRGEWCDDVVYAVLKEEWIFQR